MPDNPNDTVQMDVQQFIDLAGQRAGVPKWFHDAIFGKESAGGRPDIHDSNKGAIGPGQLMPDTAKRLGVNPRDPFENILGSLKLQRQLLDKYQKITGDTTKAGLLAAAAYNAGEGAVDKHGGIPPYAETQDYVEHMAGAIKRAKQQGTFEPQGAHPQGGGLFTKPVPQASTPAPKGAHPAGGGLFGQRPQEPDMSEFASDTKEGMSHPVKPYRMRQAPPVQFLSDEQKAGIVGGLGKPGGSSVGLNLPTNAESLNSGQEMLDYFREKGAQRDLGQAIKTTSQWAGAMLNMDGDAAQSFTEGVAGAGGFTAKQVGAAVGLLDNLNPLHGYAQSQGQEDPIQQWLTGGGTTTQGGAEESSKLHRPETAGQAVKQEFAKATGASLVELPKLMLGDEFLGAANLAAQGGFSAYTEEGVHGLKTGSIQRGVLSGIAYHYGGGVTGKYLGRFGNTLTWVGAPAVEDHLVNGTPLLDALGKAAPMGIFAGVGGSERAHVYETDGSIRPARLTDLAKIADGKLKLVEPEQVVMHKAVQQARSEIQRILLQANGDELPYLRQMINDRTEAMKGNGLDFGSEQHTPYVFKGQEDLDEFKERHGDLTNHPARRTGFETAPEATIWNYFAQLDDFSEKYNPAARADFEKAFEAWKAGDLKTATVSSELALDKTHQLYGNAQRWMVGIKQLGEEGAYASAAEAMKAQKWEKIDEVPRAAGMRYVWKDGNGRTSETSSPDLDPDQELAQKPQSLTARIYATLAARVGGLKAGMQSVFVNGRMVDVAENEVEFLNEKIAHQIKTLEDIAKAKPENYLTPEEKALSVIVRLRQLDAAHEEDMKDSRKPFYKTGLSEGIKKGFFYLGQRRSNYTGKLSEEYRTKRNELVRELYVLQGKAKDLPSLISRDDLMTRYGYPASSPAEMQKLTDWAVTAKIQTTDQKAAEAFEQSKAIMALLRDGGLRTGSPKKALGEPLPEQSSLLNERGEGPLQGKIKFLPAAVENHLVTLGAFHYEAGTRDPADWLGRMFNEISNIPHKAYGQKRGFTEGPDTVEPKVMEQLGKIYARSKALYEAGSAPTFVDGLKQTVLELRAQNQMGDTVKVERLLNLLKSRVPEEALRASGLNMLLDSPEARKSGVKVDDILNWLDLHGMTMDVLKGQDSKETGFSRQLALEEGDAKTLPGASTRIQYVTPGNRNYIEGVVHSNKAMPMSTDEVHFGVRPDQISWYRATFEGDGAVQGEWPEGQPGDRFDIVRHTDTGMWGVDDISRNMAVYDPRTNSALTFKTEDEARFHAEELNGRERPKQWISNAAKLEEVQSKRNDLMRRYGVTTDVTNVHSQLIDAQREADANQQKIRELQDKIDASWDAADQYDRYVVGEDFRSEGEEARRAYEQASAEQQRELDRLSAKQDDLDSIVNELEHKTDSQPVPWSPFLDNWHEPAIKGFLRHALEQLEPDAEGNTRVTWASASEQLKRYPYARNLLTRLQWTKNEGVWKIRGDGITDAKNPFFYKTQEGAQKSVDILNRNKPGKREAYQTPQTWDLTLFAKDQSGQERIVKSHQTRQLTEQGVTDLLGKEAAQMVIGDKPTKIHPATKVRELDAKDIPVGGDWTVKLYGDTAENIATLFPNKPELLKYAWKPSGNSAIVPSFMERYGKALGGHLETRLEPEKTYSGFDDPDLPISADDFEEAAPDNKPYLVVPEEMRNSILKGGQTMYGKGLPPLPGSAKSPESPLYGIRNRATTPESYRANQELLARSLGTSLQFQRNMEQAIEGVGLKAGAPELNPRVKTDEEPRKTIGQAIAGVAGSITRNRWTASTSRWMMSFDHPLMDELEKRFFTAQTREHDFAIAFTRRLSAITELLKGSVDADVQNGVAVLRKGRLDKTKWEQTQRDFVGLLEKDFTVAGPNGVELPNPLRQSGNPLIQKALEEHDSLTKDFKTYLMDQMEARGIQIPDRDTWGLTTKGYFRHLFPGIHNIFVDGEFYEGPERGNVASYTDAIVLANKLQDQNPNAVVEIRKRPTMFMDPAQRVSSKQYEKLVRNLAGHINSDGEQVITAREARKDLVGVVGKKENLGKFFAATLKREGYEGFSTMYEQVMKTHLFQLVRTQELSNLRKDIQPNLDQLAREHMTGAVEGVERLMADLWGKPLGYEQAFGELIQNIPAIKDRLVNPDLGLEMLARKNASIINLLKLKYNPKSAFINNIQPLRTLWPFMSTKELLETTKRMHNEAWKQKMAELGVMKGAVKLETGASGVERFGPKQFFRDPFTYISGLNRARGYTAGIVKAEGMGLSDYDSHEMGLRWARQVEFDNSKWDSPRMLRHSAGQIFGQYKGFLIKDIENAIEIFQGQTKYKTQMGMMDNSIPQRAVRAGKWLAGTAVAGGSRAALSPLSWIGTAAGYSTYLGAAAIIKATTGANDKDAKAYAAWLYLGPPAMGGLDISSSVTPLDEPQGWTPFEKIGRWTLGPTVTGAVDITHGVYRTINPGVTDERTFGERAIGTGAKITPYVRMAQRFYQTEEMLRTGRRPTIQLDRNEVTLTPAQTVMGIFGVPPASQTLYYEEKEATGSSPFSGYPTRPFDGRTFKPMPRR